MRHVILLYNLGSSYAMIIEAWDHIVQSEFLIIFSQGDPEEDRRIRLGTLFQNAAAVKAHFVSIVTIVCFSTV